MQRAELYSNLGKKEIHYPQSTQRKIHKAHKDLKAKISHFVNFVLLPFVTFVVKKIL